MKTIKQTYIIKAPVNNVWRALVDPVAINDWGGGPAFMNSKVGTKFKLWGGDIHGENIKVVENKELVQDWFGGKWEKASKVIFTLKKIGSETRINLLHEGVPDDAVKEIDEGWRIYYLGPMKKLLEK